MEKQLEPRLLKQVKSRTENGSVSVDDLLPRTQTVVHLEGDEVPMESTVPNPVIAEITAEFKQRTDALLKEIVDDLNSAMTDCADASAVEFRKTILRFVGATRIAVERIQADFLANAPTFHRISAEVKEAESGEDMYGCIVGVMRNHELRETVRNGQNEWAELLLASKLAAAAEKFKNYLLSLIYIDMFATREKLEQLRRQLEEKTKRRRELKHDPGTGKKGGAKEAEFTELTRDIGYLTGCDVETGRPLKLDSGGRPVTGILESSEEDLRKRERVEKKVKHLTLDSFLQDETSRSVVSGIGVEGEPSLASADEVRAYTSILNKYVEYVKSRLMQNQAYLRKYGTEQAFQNLNPETIVAELIRDMDIGVSFVSPEPVVLPSVVVPDTQHYRPARGKLDKIKRSTRMKIMLALAAIAAVTFVFSKVPNGDHKNYEKRRQAEFSLRYWEPESYVDVITVDGEKKIRVNAPELPLNRTLADGVEVKWKFPHNFTAPAAEPDGSMLLPFDQKSLTSLYHAGLAITLFGNALKIPSRAGKARLSFSDEMTQAFETARLSRLDYNSASEAAKTRILQALLSHPLIIRYGLTRQDARYGNELEAINELQTPREDMPDLDGLVDSLSIRITPLPSATTKENSSQKFKNVGSLNFGYTASSATSSYMGMNGLSLDEFMAWTPRDNYTIEAYASVFWKGVSLQVNMSGSEIGHGIRLEQDAVLEELVARMRSGTITQEMLKNNRREVISRIVKDLLVKHPFKIQYPDCDTPLVREGRRGESIFVIPDFLREAVSFFGLTSTASHDYPSDADDGVSDDFNLLALRHVPNGGIKYDEKVSPSMPPCATLNKHPITINVSTKAAGTLRFEDAVDQGLIAIEIAGKRK